MLSGLLWILVEQALALGSDFWFLIIIYSINQTPIRNNFWDRLFDKSLSLHLWIWSVWFKDEGVLLVGRIVMFKISIFCLKWIWSRNWMYINKNVEIDYLLVFPLVVWLFINTPPPSHSLLLIIDCFGSICHQTNLACNFFFYAQQSGLKFFPIIYWLTTWLWTTGPNSIFTYLDTFWTGSGEREA